MTLRLQDMVVLTGPHELCGLAGFDGLRIAVQELLGPGQPQSVAVAGVARQPDGSENTHILAWFHSLDGARSAVKVVCEAILAGVCVVEWDKVSRPATDQEMAALGLMEQAANAIAQLSPEQLAQYTQARQQMTQQPPPQQPGQGAAPPPPGWRPGQPQQQPQQPPPQQPPPGPGQGTGYGPGPGWRPSPAPALNQPAGPPAARPGAPRPGAQQPFRAG